MEVIAPHLKTIRTIAFLAVAVVAIEAALPWSPLGPIIPHLLGRLSAPTGFPSDTQTSWNHLDGIAWWYCRNTPSGHVRIGVQDESPEPFFRLQSGMGCARTRDGDPPLAPSLTTPAFVVGRSEVVSFAVPKPPGGWGHNTPCEFTLSAPYLHMARRHLAELMSLDYSEKVPCQARGSSLNSRVLLRRKSKRDFLRRRWLFLHVVAGSPEILNVRNGSIADMRIAVVK